MIPDPYYAQVPLTTLSYVGRGTAAVTLAPGATAICAQTVVNGQALPPLQATVNLYDRGFATATYVVDESGQPSRVVLDGLGRTIEETGPDPRAAGALAPAPGTYVAYAPGSPLSAVTTYRQIGADVSSSAYVASVSYVDGLGREVGSAAAADPSAGDGPPAIRAPDSSRPRRRPARRSRSTTPSVARSSPRRPTAMPRRRWLTPYRPTYGTPRI
jgi:hypothetical protein